jgi:hypothetical protein
LVIGQGKGVFAFDQSEILGAAFALVAGVGGTDYPTLVSESGGVGFTLASGTTLAATASAPDGGAAAFSLIAGTASSQDNASAAEAGAASFSLVGGYVLAAEEIIVGELPGGAAFALISGVTP